MNFSIGELVFNSNFKDENPILRSGLNATEVTSLETTLRLKVLAILKEDLPLSLSMRKLR
jgi:hypothetical protein